METTVVWGCYRVCNYFGLHGTGFELGFFWFCTWEVYGLSVLRSGLIRVQGFVKGAWAKPARILVRALSSVG